MQKSSWGRQALILILTLIAAFIFVYSYAAVAEGKGRYSNDCEGWAQEIVAEPGSRAMHSFGCDESARGSVWQAEEGYCAKLARQEARKGYVPVLVRENVEAASKGFCVVAEDGTYITRNDLF